MLFGSPEDLPQADLLEALRRHPANPRRWSDLGEAMVASKQLEKAQLFFSNALALGPNRPEWPSWALGVWLAGGALVPLPAPVRVRDAEAYSLQIRSLLDAVGCRLVATDPKFASAVPEERLLLWNTATPSVRELPTSVDAARGQ